MELKAYFTSFIGRLLCVACGISVHILCFPPVTACGRMKRHLVWGGGGVLTFKQVKLFVYEPT